MNEPLLIADSLRKVYRTGAEEVVALRDVDLVVHDGEFVSVMGPSGSGKTTLLNCCSGLDDIDGGHVLLDGVDLHSLSDAQRTANRASSMGFVFQAYNLIPVFSAVENVELPLLLAGVDGKDARASARSRHSNGSGSVIDSSTGPRSSRAANSNASPLLARLRDGRAWCGPTSLRVRSTPRPPTTCSRFCVSCTPTA